MTAAARTLTDQFHGPPRKAVCPVGVARDEQTHDDLSSPAFSLIIPVFGNAESLPELLSQIDRIGERLNGELEVVFVVDGSPDDSYAILQSRLANRPGRSRLIALSRNFGSFSAIRTGLIRADGHFFAVMAADLQDPPELIIQFFQTLADEEIDVVIGTRVHREDPWASRLLSACFWFMYRKVVIRDVPPGGADLFGCTSQVRNAVCSLSEVRTSLIGLLFWVGFRRKFLPYRRLPRPFGKSGWSFRRRFRYMLDSIYAFTDLPIVILTMVGLFGVLTSIVVALIVLGAWLLDWITVPGYTPIILALSFFSMLNLCGLGVIGAYVWRTYENGKDRPHSLIMSEKVFGANV
jgi:glycosyltransferase involved in cell wall biosynthesis